jgi:hypothetical protein
MATAQLRKATFEIAATAKHRLERFQSRLRLEGYSATEAGIVEYLINVVSLSELRAAFQGRKVRLRKPRR